MYHCIVVMVYMYIIDSKWRKEEMVELREKERATDQLFMSIGTCTQYITCTHVYCMLYPIGLFMFARGLAVFCQTRPRRNPTEMSNA